MPDRDPLFFAALRCIEAGLSEVEICALAAGGLTT